MYVGQLGSMTSARLTVIGIDATPCAAACSLARPGIGLIVVTGGNGQATGVLSKSDLIRHLADPDLPTTTVAALMSRTIVSCHPDDDLHSTWQMMARKSLQNMPVLGADAKPVGVLDIRDAMKALFEQEELQERLLANYIAGVGYQ